MTMTEELRMVRDPVLWRLQQAYWREEPSTDLAAVIRRAAGGRALTEDDLAAARRRDPAAVARLYTAYAPELLRMFEAAVGDQRQAEDLTGTTFVSAIESLPRFRGPIEALGGWLFQIARHDLYDHRRRQSRSRIEPLEEPEAVEAPERMLAELFGGPTGSRGLAAGARLRRLSPREREVLRLTAEGHSNRAIAEELLVSLHTVRTHMQNILVKLQMHTKLEAVSFAIDHGWLDDASGDPVDRLADRVADRVDDRQVAAAVRQLPPDQREVLLLRMFGGLTAPEVADVLGTTTGAVKALQHRGLANLTRNLGLQGPGPEPGP
jgi:RNA polymerase sigma factor (sigma-70 family)